jgi:hypothetical protein
VSDRALHFAAAKKTSPVGVLPLEAIAITAALLMIISSAVLIPEAHAERRVRPAMPITVVAGD